MIPSGWDRSPVGDQVSAHLAPPAAPADRRPAPAWMGFDPARPAPRWGIPAFLAVLGAFVLGGILTTLPLVMFTNNARVLSIAGVLGSWTAAAIGLVLVSEVRGQRSLRLDFGLWFRWVDPFIGAGGALVVLLLNPLLMALVQRVFGRPPESNVEAILGGRDDVTLIVMAVLVALGAPVFEELVFRGLGLRACERRLGPVLGVLASAAAFALPHFPLGSADESGQMIWPSAATIANILGATFLYGIIFAVMTRICGRLGPAIFAHFTINGLIAIFYVANAFAN